ncbi:MAG TPA: microviridin/marinostatin family tricyclic proteinase inhibitor [Nostocaceae cyanobacterium]|nr:microviridin/marinostatin family tricyclic proteinase inhibitor [Nostocaceae cyanobacterium]
MSNIKLENLPFFTRFLEGQSCEDVTEEEMESVNGGCGFTTKKYPSDQEEDGFATKKYPSDTDEMTTEKYPSDSDESGVSF